MPVFDALPLRKTPTLNIPLMRKTMETIESHPEDWEQTTWGARFDPDYDERPRHSMAPCATACCFAGTACLLAGAEFVNVYNSEVSFPDGNFGHAGNVAQRLLGLSDFEASALFDSHNSLAELREMTDGLIAAAEGAQVAPSMASQVRAHFAWWLV